MEVARGYSRSLTLAPQDGGYHVPFAHPGLASGLDMQSYRSELCNENLSIQRVVASESASDRLAGGLASVSWALLVAARHLHAALSEQANGQSVHNCLALLIAGGSTGSSGSAADADAVFAFVYPNLMVNAYGPWVDTNLVRPESADSCSVQFDWYVTQDRAGDKVFTKDSIAASHEVRLGKHKGTARVSTAGQHSWLVVVRCI